MTWPGFLAPMLAYAAPLPTPQEDDDFAYEMKWDGIRALAYVRHGGLTLFARSGRDMTPAYPELQEVIAAAGPTPVVLDGEIVALDEAGRPDFGLLQRRMHVADPAASRRLGVQVPATYLAFDVVHLGDRSLMSLSYEARRAALDDLGLAAERVAAPPALPLAGIEALEVSRAQGLEGIVAKRRASVYNPGRRSADWRKIKNIASAEVLVAGWKAGEGRRQGGIGSLLLAVPDGSGALRFVGHVGSGFTSAMLDELYSLLAPLERQTAPFVDTVPAAQARHARWVEPVMVAEVAYSNWTRDGRLRHPVWRGLRPDKRPADVQQDAPPA